MKRENTFFLWLLVSLCLASSQVLAFSPVDIAKIISSLGDIKEQLHDLEKNTKGITQHEWTDIEGDLAALEKATQTVSGITYLSQHDLFSKRFPGYKDAKQYKGDYQLWSNTAIDTLQAGLAITQTQNEQLARETRHLQRLKQQTEKTGGRMEAIQVNNEIAIEQLAQMQKVRQLLMSQIQSQNVYMAAQEQKEAHLRASRERLFPKKKAGRGEYYETFKGGTLDAR